ncbi:MAG: hypothetical protein ACR2PR_07485 [Pseudohongiellaceae bacterium]
MKPTVTDIQVVKHYDSSDHKLESIDLQIDFNNDRHHRVRITKDTDKQVIKSTLLQLAFSIEGDPHL